MAIEFIHSLEVAGDLDVDGKISKTGGGDSIQWDTAYGWGNHASEGYLTNSSPVVKQLSDGETPDYFTPSSRRVNPNALNPTNHHYAISTFGNGGNVTGQLATHFQSGLLYSRGYNSSWSTWKKYHNTGDFTVDEVSKGVTAYGWGDHSKAEYLTALPSHNHAATDITSGTLDNKRLKWNSTDDFTGTYSLLWNASDALYTATWLKVRGTDDTLLTRSIIADGNVTGDNLMVSNWNAAHGWGDHGTEGYLTALPSHNHDGRYLKLNPRLKANADTITQSGIHVWDVSEANDDPSGASDGLLTTKYWDSSDWAVQSYHDFHTNNLFIRSKQSGTWQEKWAEVWTSDNFTEADIAKGVTAHGWGNHADAGYVTSSGVETELDPVYKKERDDLRFNKMVHSTLLFDELEDYNKPSGYSTMIQPSSYNNPLSSHGYYHVLGRRDGEGGYGALLQHYNSHELFHGVTTQNTKDISWYNVWTSGDFAKQDVTEGATAYTWGDHSSAGYAPKDHSHTFASLTSKPTTLSGFGITDAATGAQGTKADTAHGWGDHSSAGYVTTDNDTVFNGGTVTNAITSPRLALTNNAEDTTANRITVYDSGTTSYGMMLWNASGTSSDWATMIYGPNQSNRRISFGKANADFAKGHSGVDELAWLDLDNGNYFTDGNIYPGGSTTKYVSTGRIDNWNTAHGWGNHASAGYLTRSKPESPKISSAIVGETIEVIITASGTSDIDQYLVFSSVGGSDFGLISVIPPDDFSASMSVIDNSFDAGGEIEYRVYAVKQGVYSDVATTSQTFTVGTLEPTQMSVVSLNTAHYVQWDAPSSKSRFVSVYNVYHHDHDTESSLARASATLIYSGTNTSYMKPTSNNKFHKFWVEITNA